MVTMIRSMPNCFSGARRQRHHDGGAVRIGDDLAFPAALALLARNELQMIVIDLRHQQRHIGFHAMIARVRDDDVSRMGEGALDFGRDGSIRRGEHELRRVAGLAFMDVEVRRCSGHGAVETPARRVAILLAGRAIARAHPRQIEPRMILQETSRNAGRPCRWRQELQLRFVA